MCYFDAVLDSQYMPLFNGTRRETIAWLKQRPVGDGWMVCLGETLQIVPVVQYLADNEDGL